MIIDFLVTRSRDGVVPFVQFVEQVLPTLPAERQAVIRWQLARTLGEFLALLHDAGVAHPDPHPGNLLVELPPEALTGGDDVSPSPGPAAQVRVRESRLPPPALPPVPRFYLIDLHAIRHDPRC